MIYGFPRDQIGEPVEVPDVRLLVRSGPFEGGAIDLNVYLPKLTLSEEDVKPLLQDAIDGLAGQQRISPGTSITWACFRTSPLKWTASLSYR